MRRYLCADLVILKFETAGGRQTVANIEEIWPEGAVVETESADITPGENAEIIPRESGGANRFAGHVTKVERHEYGCRIEIEFSPWTRWNIEIWKPDHLTDPESLGDI